MYDEKINNPLKDNSTWDATIKYISKPERRFELECLNTLLPTFSINHIWVYNQNGESIYYVNDTNSIDLSQILPAKKILGLLPTNYPFCHFFWKQENRLFEIFGATVTSSFDINHKEAPRGFLFFAKTWDSTFIHSLSKSSDLKLTLQNKLSDSSEIFNYGNTCIYFDLRDINGDIAGRLKVENKILFKSQWDEQYSRAILINIIIGILVVIFIGVLLFYWITKPLNLIIKSLDEGSDRRILTMQSHSGEFGKIANLIMNDFKLKNELKASKVIAEESSKLKSSLLMNMSHELRTPLNGILGFAHLLREALTDSDLISMTDVISISGKRLMATLNSIMDLSQLESNQTKVDNEVLDIGAETNEAIEGNHQMFERKQIQIIYNIKREIYASVDKRLFRNILFHLVDNAIKFTEAGSVSIVVKEITKNNAKFAGLKIKDTGIGISKEQLTYIFDAFRQGDEGIGRSHEGTGIGLTLCKKFVTLMGGEIEVETKLGAGSTFTVLFPLVKQPSREEKLIPVEEEPEIQLPGAKKPRVLIVEDNEILVELAGMRR